jgi:transposase
VFRSVISWGMKTYPIELRQKIVDAVDQQLGTYKEIAEMFSIAERYIYKLVSKTKSVFRSNLSEDFVKRLR